MNAFIFLLALFDNIPKIDECLPGAKEWDSITAFRSSHNFANGPVSLMEIAQPNNSLYKFDAVVKMIHLTDAVNPVGICEWMTGWMEDGFCELCSHHFSSPILSQITFRTGEKIISYFIVLRTAKGTV